MYLQGMLECLYIRLNCFALSFQWYHQEKRVKIDCFSNFCMFYCCFIFCTMCILTPFVYVCPNELIPLQTCMKLLYVLQHVVLFSFPHFWIEISMKMCCFVLFCVVLTFFMLSSLMLLPLWLDFLYRLTLLLQGLYECAVLFPRCFCDDFGMFGVFLIKIYCTFSIKIEFLNYFVICILSCSFSSDWISCSDWNCCCRDCMSVLYSFPGVDAMISVCLWSFYFDLLCFLY